MSAYIEFQNVKKVYEVGEVGIQALTDVDFTIDKGGSVVIAGASGVDKSIILNILNDMGPSTSGSIFVDGTEINKFNAKQLATYRRYDIGFVFQFYDLMQNLTVKGGVGLAIQICRQPLDINRTIEAVGLKERVSSFSAQLSGKEQQRVVIVRILAKDPKLLLCDGPTEALDYNVGKQTLKLLQNTCRQRGVNVVVTIHNLALTATGDKAIRV